jgi:hypothetical protein
MSCCLFISIITVVLVLVVLNEIGKNINEDGDIILTPNQLRGMIVEDIVEMHYTSIYDTVIDGAVKGKTVAYFTIMCYQSQGICNYDGFQVWTQRRYKDSKPNINQELVKTRLIEKLQSSFPGSNITKGYKNCCDQYRINW